MLAENNSGKCGVQIEGSKSKQFSNVSRMVDVNYRSLHDNEEKDSDDEYIKPQTPAYY